MTIDALGHFLNRIITEQWEGMGDVGSNFPAMFFEYRKGNYIYIYCVMSRSLACNALYLTLHWTESSYYKGNAWLFIWGWLCGHGAPLSCLWPCHHFNKLTKHIIQTIMLSENISPSTWTCHSCFSLYMFMKHDWRMEGNAHVTRRSTRGVQTSCAEADHYPHIALSFDQPGL